MHLHAWPDGKAFPCCLSDPTKPVGNLNQTKIIDIVNGDAYRQIKRKMLAGEPVDTCYKCYEQEAVGMTSMRVNSFKYHPSDFKDFKLKYLDIRFSNVCNLACVSCGPTFSSKWHTDWIKLGRSSGHERIMSLDIMEQLKTDYLYDVENVTFAGGEPLVTTQHYEILDYFIENNKQVNISYITNLTNLEFQKRNILDTWKKFERISMLVSIDNVWDRFDYIRWGAGWKQVLENLNRVRSECPHIDIKITPSISILNILDLDKLERAIHTFTGIHSYQYNVISYPDNLKADLLPKEHRTEVARMTDYHREWLAEHNLTSEMPDLVDNLMKTHSSGIESTRTYLQDLDRIRGTNSQQLFPYIW